MANEQQPEQQLSAHGSARRRFTRAGAAATGVLLTVHSQPGMAATVCTTPSGFHSINFGSHNPRAAACSGLSPGGWKSAAKPGHKGNKATWPVEPTRLFREWFKPGLDQYGTLGSDQATLKFVVENIDNQFDPQNLGAHLVAALLNHLSGRSPVPTTATLVDIWIAMRDTHQYVPNGGAPAWDVVQVKKYLTSTMG